MGCGCKAKKQITFLEKKYGDNLPKSKTTKIRENVIGSVKSAGMMLLLIPVFPIFVIYILLKGKKRPLDIKKTFKLAA